MFLTNDTEFEDLAAECHAQVIISRLPQRLAISQRVAIWLGALEGFLERKPTEKLFDLLPDGRILAWEIREGSGAFPKKGDDDA